MNRAEVNRAEVNRAEVNRAEVNRAERIKDLRRALRANFPESHPRLRREGREGLATGIPALDALLSGGGLAGGRIAEICGGASSGKTSVAMRIVATTIQKVGPVAYVDLGRTFFPPSAARAGVVLERLLVVSPSNLREGMKAVDILVRGQAFPLVVVDWGRDPQGEPGDLGTMIARLNGLCALSQTVLLFITSPKTARAPLRYYAAVRMEVRRERMDASVSPWSDVDARNSAGVPPVRLTGLPIERPPSSLVLHVVKNKLFSPGARVRVGLYGSETVGMPLHPGFPHSAPLSR